MKARFAAAVVAALSLFSCVSTRRPSAGTQPPVDAVRRIAASPGAVAAFAFVEASHDAILSEWKTITEVNAPSGHEEKRAELVRRLLDSPSLSDIHSDAAGNLIALRKGTGGGPAVVIDAHLDTVFQPGLEIHAVIRDGRIFAPGVGDDTRNVEAMLATIRALERGAVKTRGDLIFVFTVGEETDFRGVQQFLSDHQGSIDRYIALDGGYEGLTYGGIGINWYRMHFIGPGGHTRSRTPPFSATLPAARAIERIYRLRVPRVPSSNLNIGMMQGSDVVNAKAADAWFSVDLRSTSDDVIAALEQRITAIVRDEAGRAGMEARIETISRDPAAQLAGNRDSPLVLTSIAVAQVIGFTNPTVSDEASNHSSAALRAGISSISTGSAPCSGSHSLQESCEIEPLYRGIRKLILLAVANAGLSE